MKLTDLQAKVRGIHSFITDALLPRGPGATSTLELIEQADEALDKLEAELVLDPPSLGRKLSRDDIGETDVIDQKSEGAARTHAMGGGVVGPATAADLLPNCDSELAQALKLGFAAEISLWDGKTQQHYTRPDAKIRLETAKTYLAYRLGMPPQMRLNIDAGFRDQQTELVEIAKTPMGRAQLLRAGVIDENWIARHLPAPSQK